MRGTDSLVRRAVPERRRACWLALLLRLAPFRAALLFVRALGTLLFLGVDDRVHVALHLLRLAPGALLSLQVRDVVVFAVRLVRGAVAQCRMPAAVPPGFQGAVMRGAGVLQFGHDVERRQSREISLRV